MTKIAGEQTKPTRWSYTWLSDPGVVKEPLSRDDRPWPEALAAANARATKPIHTSEFLGRSRSGLR